MRNKLIYAAFIVFLLSASAMDSDVMWMPGLLCVGSLLVLMKSSRKEVRDG